MSRLLDELKKVAESANGSGQLGEYRQGQITVPSQVILALIDDRNALLEALKFYADRGNWGTYPEDHDSGKNALLIAPDSDHYSSVWVGSRARKAIAASEARIAKLEE